MVIGGASLPDALSATVFQAAQQATPTEQEADIALNPSAEALRVSEQAVLTGLETGTMWTFENAPVDYWESTYGFRPTAEWLEHVRLSSVRYGQSCSASFVSPDGLVMTNHHCARACTEAVSTSQQDYVETGFYAATKEEELLCPGLYLDQLVQISSVTERVRAAAPSSGSSTEIADAMDTEQEEIEEECEARSGLECQVVSLYNGGQYQLYEYKRFSPVKLVFIPELQAGFFGGDPDNFTYPRFVLDLAFVRAYEPDSVQAASTPHHFEWDPEGAGEGELVFITGNPGSTDRQATVSQLLYEQVYRHPFIVQILEGQRSLLQYIATFGPEAERSVRDQLFGVENSLKAYTGQLGGLRDTTLVGQKIRWEAEFRQRISADPELQATYGDVWDRLTDLQIDKLYTSPRLNSNDPDFGGNPLMQLAGTLARYADAMATPEAGRDSTFLGESLQETEELLRAPVQVSPEIAQRLLALRLAIADRWLEPDDPFRELAFQPGESPEDAAARLVRETQIGDPAFRESVMQGELDPKTSEDALLRLAASMVEAMAELRPHWDSLQASEVVEEERLARALFAAFGTDLPPDATFTLRISDGVVSRYAYNGTFAPPHTSFFGLFERASNFSNEMPWTLPPAFAEHQEDLDMSAPLNFVTTNDITGGNSGSPMIDRDARVVGLAFDGNIEQLPNEFLFRIMAGRTIGVHSAGITEALRSVYQADALLAELLGDGG
jgi:hypothetical protein